MNDRKRAGFQERFERLFQIHILSGSERSRRGIGKTDILLRILPGHRVFHPGEIVFLKTFAELDAVFQRDVSEVIDRNRNFIADLRTDVRHVLLQIVESDFRDMDSGERVRRVEEVVCLSAHRARVDRAVRRAENRVFVFAHLLKEAERSGKRAGNVHQQFNAEIHLEKGEPLCHALLESFAHVASAAFGIGIAVAPDFIAVFPAEKLPDRHAPGLAREVPHRQLESADSARLTRIAAELFDAAEDLFRIARILTENAALKHRSIRAAGGVADFAVTDKPLVRVDFDQCAAFRRTVDIRKADVGDFQCGGINFHLFRSLC